MIWLLIIPFVLYFALFLRVTCSHFRISSDTGEKKLNQTTVSVVVACRNEENNIPSLLSWLTSQDYPKNLYEIIIVDDHSEDNTFNIASEFKGTNNLKVIKNRGTGKKSAIFTGVMASVSELIITTDADCHGSKSWISYFASFYETEHPCLILAPVRLSMARGFLNIFQQLEWAGLQGITAGTAVAGSPVICNGANLGFTKETYLLNSSNLHPDIPSGDDVFLLHSVKSAWKNKISWLGQNEAVVVTQPSASVLTLLKQRARWVSKAGAYRDPFTLFVSVLIFITTIIQGFVMVASIADLKFLPVFLAALAIKSSADTAIIKSGSNILQEKHIRNLRWLIFLELISPFYVSGVIFFSIFPRYRRWKKD